MKKILKKIKKSLKKLLTFSLTWYIISNVFERNTKNKNTKQETGVWLSLARVPDLGSGGRRFESCHPDFSMSYMNKLHAGVVQW